MVCSYVYDNLETCKEPIKKINLANLGLRENGKVVYQIVCEKHII
jgi:hypothetical protein